MSAAAGTGTTGHGSGAECDAEEHATALNAAWLAGVAAERLSARAATTSASSVARGRMTVIRSVSAMVRYPPRLSVASKPPVG